MAPFGVTPIAWYAMDAMRYMHETRVDHATIAEVAVKSRRAATNNELAQFRDPLNLEEVLSARRIVDPLGLYEVPAVADGAICLVLASIDAAEQLGPTLRHRDWTRLQPRRPSSVRFHAA